MSKRKQTRRATAAGGIAADPDGLSDDLAYLTQWAASLAASVTPDELRAMLKGYEALARNGTLSAQDRGIARNRAKALNRHL